MDDKTIKLLGDVCTEGDVLTVFNEVEAADFYKPFDASQMRTEPYVADINHLSAERLLADKDE